MLLLMLSKFLSYGNRYMTHTQYIQNTSLPFIFLLHRYIYFESRITCPYINRTTKVKVLIILLIVCNKIESIMERFPFQFMMKLCEILNLRKWSKETYDFIMDKIKSDPASGKIGLTTTYGYCLSIMESMKVKLVKLSEDLA